MTMNSNDIRRIKGVDSILAIIFYEAQRTCNYEIHIAYLGGLRTSDEQYELFKKKKSKKNGISNKSKHQLGEAIDFVIYIDGKANWDVEKYDEVAQHMIGIAEEKFNTKLRGGWDWNQNGIPVRNDPKETFQDAGHVELI